MTRNALAAALVSLWCVSTLTALQPAPLPRFDAASVRENRSGGTNVQFDILPGGRFGTTNAPLSQIVRVALAGVNPIRLVGLPSWAETTRYDISAKAEGEPSREQILLMARALLIDRFGLVVHQESQDTDVYFLVAAHADRAPGPRLRRSAVNCAALVAAAQKGQPLPASNRILCGRTLRSGTMMAGGLPMETIAGSFTAYAGRPVLDRTGLDGEWDFDLDFAEALPADASSRADAPTIFTAVQEQLGLKLEAGRAAMEVTVIDRLERPAAD